MREVPAQPVEAGPGQGRALGHVVPLRVLLGVWAALVALTVVTIAATRVDLGGLNLWVALGIATVKAAMVALYFMHLRYDHPLNAIVFIAALLFVAVFVGIVMLDAEAYQPTIREYQHQTVTPGR